MPAIAPLTLHDGSAYRTYSPLSITGDITTFVDRATTSVAAGQSTILISFSSLNSKRATDKTNVTLALPRVINEVVNGVTVPRIESVGRYASGNFIIPGSWTLVERQQLVHLVASLLSNETFHLLPVNRDTFY